MMAVAFLCSAWVLVKEMKRKESAGLMRPFIRTRTKGKPAGIEDYLLHAAGGFVVGYKLVPVIWQFHVFAQDPQAFLLSGHGTWWSGLVLAAAVAYLKYYENRKERKDYPEPVPVSESVWPHQTVGDITILAAISGLIGAKVFDGLENPATFFQTIFSPFAGLTFYGGLLFGTLTVIWYIRRKKISIIHMADAIAPSLILAYGLGRIGCQLAGDGDWGIINASPKPSWFILPEWVWHFNYPHNVVEEGVAIPGCVGRYCTELPQPVFPTPFYETVMSLFLFVLLWRLRKKIQIPGVLFSLYILLNGIERLLIELIRVNARYEIGGFSFTQAEMIASFLILAGAGGILFFRRRYRRQMPQ